MRITSCNCLSKTGFKIKKCSYTEGLFTLEKENEFGLKKVKTELNYVKFCPFCGEKIKVEE